MQPDDVILEHRCCLTNLGRHLICVGGVLAVGMAALDTVLVLTSIVPAPVIWLDSLLQVGMLFALAIQILLPVACIWNGIYLCRVGGEFTCQLSREAITQFDPAARRTFALPLTEIAHIEQRSDGDGDGGYCWILWGHDGAEHRLSVYDNPADEFGEQILALRPGLELRRTRA